MCMCVCFFLSPFVCMRMCMCAREVPGGGVKLSSQLFLEYLPGREVSCYYIVTISQRNRKKESISATPFDAPDCHAIEWAFWQTSWWVIPPTS